MQQRLPPSVLLGLAALAASTFAVGLFLEQVALGFLQRHPYVVNLLSGATGFSTSALVIALLFNRAVVTHRAEQWRAATWTAVRGWQQQVNAMERLVEAPAGVEADGDTMVGLGSLHADVLHALIAERGGHGLRLREDPPPLPNELPFRKAEDETTFLRHANSLVDNWLDPLLEALDVATEPEVLQAAYTLRASVRDPGRQSYQVADAVSALVKQLENHPHYRASRRMRLSAWDRFTLAIDRRRLPFRR
ncbi:hypothetical protein AB0M02_46180 [Actinoplanes sp. NPDC051861]|uniref:hypothetical protein n=1 Tax=Actinoplanes sp. NPDC051861 TaxID=3155170 RepID=UPI003418C12B